MDTLELAVSDMRRWPAAKAREKSRVGALFKALVGDLEDAIKIWSGVTENVGPKETTSLALMVGPERAKRLHEISLQATAHARQICVTAGGRPARMISLEDGLVEEAYRQLKNGESVSDRAQASVVLLRTRIERLQAMARQLSA